MFEQLLFDYEDVMKACAYLVELPPAHLHFGFSSLIPLSDNLYGPILLDV